VAVGRSRGGGGRQRLVRVGAVVVVLIVVVFLATRVLGGGGGSGPTTGSNGGGTASVPGVGASPQTAGPAPSSVIVTVLNGSGVPRLAYRISLKLTNAGYRKANVTVGNATSTTNAATTVAYASGQQAAATAVASTIGARPASVVALSGTPASGSPNAQVVVTVGSDLKQ
jgi:hypothetical protein